MEGRKRGRPLGSKNRKKINSVPMKFCTNCNRELPLTDYYVASNPLTSSDGKYVNICKNCIKSASLNMDGSLNVEAFKKTLMLIDRPFVPDVIDRSITEVKKSVNTKKRTDDVIGTYMKNISSLPQYSKMNFMDSMKLINNQSLPSFGCEKNKTNNKTSEKDKNNIEKDDVYVSDNSDFVLTQETVERFGDGYNKNQYCKMQKKYDKLKQNYQLTTNLHEEALATYVRFKVKEEEATASGDVDSANKWNKAAQDAAEKAKLTPKQLTQADLQGGITAISEISKAVEEAADIIEILPRFKYAPNDAPDFIIWCYINFCRSLKGLPKVSYEEVYAFYDKRKEEYISQYGDPYGIFVGDTSEKNREAVKKFIKLPKDYDMGSDDSG